MFNIYYYSLHLYHKCVVTITKHNLSFLISCVCDIWFFSLTKTVLLFVLCSNSRFAVPIITFVSRYLQEPSMKGTSIMHIWIYHDLFQTMNCTVCNISNFSADWYILLSNCELFQLHFVHWWWSLNRKASRFIMSWSYGLHDEIRS